MQEGIVGSDKSSESLAPSTVYQSSSRSETGGLRNDGFGSDGFGSDGFGSEIFESERDRWGSDVSQVVRDVTREEWRLWITGTSAGSVGWLNK